MGNKSTEPEISETGDFSSTDQSSADLADRDQRQGDGMEAGQAQTEQLLTAAREENARLKDQLLRAAADMENLRKRTRREMDDARSYAIAGFARDMLNAADNLSRALNAISEDFRNNADSQTRSLIEGIEMTDREMHRLMEKNGVRPIIAEGEKFNPHKHQAMFEVDNPEVPAGIVVQVVQGGFEIGDRVLRPAMVGVSRGGPRAEAGPRSEGGSGMDAGSETGARSSDPEQAGQGGEADNVTEPGFAGHVDKEV